MRMRSGVFGLPHRTSAMAGVLVALACGASHAAADCPNQLQFTSFGALGSITTTTAAFGDVDGDGDVDLVAASDAQTTVYVLFNAGGGTFGSQVEYPGSNSTYAVKLGDLDGDGDLDLASSTFAGLTVRINNGAGAFGPAVNYGPSGGTAFAFALGDIDADGDLDAVSADGFTGVRTFANNGNGTFAAPTAYSLFGQPQGLALADFDADGDLDAAIGVSAFGLGNVRLALNTGAGLFSFQDVPSDIPTWIDAGDLDGDGDADLVTASAGTLNVRINTGGATFLPAVNYPSPSTVYYVTLSDLDADGALDVIATPPSGFVGLGVFRNLGPGTFSSPLELGAGTNQRVAAVGDIDSDGDLDFGVPQFFGMTIQRNTGQYAPRIAVQPVTVTRCPGSPVALSVTATGTGPFTYQWRREGKPIPGATARTYTVPAVTLASVGTYDVVVTSACDSVTSTSAYLIVGGPDCCTSDWNGDGVSNSTDVSDFINSWFSDQVTGCGG